MALFFDAEWFDARLAERALDRSVLAAVTGMSEAEVAAMFKDQREVSPREVQTMAALFNESPEEIARRCGVSTRALPKDDIAGRLDAIEARLERLEKLVKP